MGPEQAYQMATWAAWFGLGSVGAVPSMPAPPGRLQRAQAEVPQLAAVTSSMPACVKFTLHRAVPMIFTNMACWVVKGATWLPADGAVRKRRAR